MGDLSRNFSRSEFACPDCGLTEIDLSLVTGLQQLRDALGKPITITSGYRCPRHNALVGGEPHSKHVLGQAADISVSGLTGRQLYEAARRIVYFRGFGVGDGFLHVDVRPTTARWCYRNGKQAPWTEDV
jgi:uncharacterized protein YcbK (DUF882 family)